MDGQNLASSLLGSQLSSKSSIRLGLTRVQASWDLQGAFHCLPDWRNSLEVGFSPTWLRGSSCDETRLWSLRRLIYGAA